MGFFLSFAGLMLGIVRDEVRPLHTDDGRKQMRRQVGS